MFAAGEGAREMEAGIAAPQARMQGGCVQKVPFADFDTKVSNAASVCAAAYQSANGHAAPLKKAN
jgi:hypothetical protein